MKQGARRVALKVDCDTYLGTRDGLPNLLRLFDRFNIRASFYFTLGPDRSGRAIARVFTRKGFLKKMLRSKAVAMYPKRTMMYGTLLPAPMIGERLAGVIRSVGDAGHEVGVHGWDHIKWHDRAVRMPEEDIAAEYGAAHREFERIFGRRARASAAPGWQASPTTLTVQDRFGIEYASNTRLGAPSSPNSTAANSRRSRSRPRCRRGMRRTTRPSSRATTRSSRITRRRCRGPRCIRSTPRWRRPRCSLSSSASSIPGAPMVLAS